MARDTILDTLMEEKLNNDASLRYESLVAIREEAGITLKMII